MTPPLSFEAIDQFKLNPQSLIPSPSTDRRAVEASTRDLAATEPQLAPDLVHVAQTAQRSFQGAIAAGLAQAELACRGVDQQAVAGFEDGQFQALFAAVVGDPSTAATDAASRRLRVPRGAWSSLTRTGRSAVRPARVAVAVLQRIRQAYLVLPVRINSLGAQSRSDGLRQFQ
jgi:hypothetical protein